MSWARKKKASESALELVNLPKTGRVSLEDLEVVIMAADASAPLLPPKPAAEPPPAAPAAAAILRAKRRDALGVSRYIASCWICAFHYYKGFGTDTRYGVEVTGDYWPSATAWSAARHYFSWEQQCDGELEH